MEYVINLLVIFHNFKDVSNTDKKNPGVWEVFFSNLWALYDRK